VLHVHRDTDAAQSTGGQACLAARGETAPVSQAEGACHVLLEGPRRDDRAARTRPGEALRIDQIASPELDAIMSSGSRGGLDQALRQVVRLDAPDPAVRREWRGVGEDSPQ